MAVVLAGPFGDYGWQASNSEYDYMNTQYDKNTEKYKKILDYTRKLYLDGVLHPNSAVNDQQAAREAFYAGQTGVLAGFGGKFSQHLIDLRKIDPEGELTYAFVKNEDGEVKGAGFGTGMWQFWSITTSCKNPEKVIEMMDYTLSDEGYDKLYAGIEGVSYHIVDGERVYVEGISQRKEAFVGLFLRRAGDAEFFITPWTSKEETAITKPIIQKAVSSVVRSLDAGYVPKVSLNPTYMDYQSTYSEGIAKILLGESDVDTYDALLEGWYDNGGEEYVQEMNAFINK